MPRITQELVRQWEGEFSIGWPEDAQELQEWHEQGFAPERTWETFTVRPPGPEMMAKLAYYAMRRPTKEAEPVMSAWRSGHAAQALDVLTLAETLSHRSLDSDAAGWLVDQLRELVSIEAQDDKTASRDWAKFQRQLQTADAKRAKKLARVRAALEELISLMTQDWRDIEDSDYLSLCKDWISYWKDI